MIELSLDKDKSYFNITGSSGDPDLDFLVPLFTTEDNVRYIETAEFPIRMSVSFYESVKDILEDHNIEYRTKKIDKYYNNPEKGFDIADKRFLTDEQYEIICNYVITNFRGVLQVKTGWGKSYIISYLNAAYKGKGKKLVLTNNNQVRDTLMLRAKELGIDTSDTRFINPIAFVNSNKWDDPEEKAWFDDVELIQIDESESVPSSTRKILDLCRKKKYVYGYSASPEKVRGTYLKDWSVIRSIKSDCLDVLAYIGFAIYYIAPKKEIQLTIYRTAGLPQEHFPYKLKFIKHERAALMMKQMASQDNIVSSRVFYEAVDNALDSKIKTLYIPYKFTHHGDQIYGHYENSGRSVIQWDGTKLRSNKWELDGISDIARRLKSGRVDLLLASSVSYRGVDFRNIYDIFMFMSSQFNDVTQIVGRGGRGSVDEGIRVYLLENVADNTPFYTIMHKSRKNKFIKIFHSPVRYINLSDLEADAGLMEDEDDPELFLF